jgi:hypothetical protein
MQRWRPLPTEPRITPIKLAVAVGPLLWFAFASSPARAGEVSSVGRPSLTVVELFTSQGCSSCPPADALIGELAQREGLLALSEHVDYWDYLGWKDPFASSAHTSRQRDYAKALGLKYVYTPQIVVQGQVQVSGSEREAVLAAVAARERTRNGLVSIGRAGSGQLVVGVAGKEGARPADVWLVLYDRRQTTRIDRGENSGRALANYNVVRSLRRLGRWQGEPVQLVADLDQEDESTRGCAIVLQSEATGPIIDAVACSARPG